MSVCTDIGNYCQQVLFFVSELTVQGLTRTLIILNARSRVFPCRSTKLIHMTTSDARSQQCCSRQQV